MTWRNCGVVLFLFTTVLLAGEEADRVELVKQYWLAEHRTKPADVQMRDPSWGIERLEGDGFEFFEGLQFNDLYCFKEGPLARSAHVVVAVNAEGKVRCLGDIKQFNQVLREESFDIDDLQGAIDLAHAFLRVYHFGGVRGGGFELGVNVVDSVEEIPISANDSSGWDRVELARNFDIHVPRMTQEGRRYRYIFFSWSPSSGNLKRHDLLVDRGTIAHYRVETLAKGIGEFLDY